MSNYVQHDGSRWRIAGSLTIDDEPGFELVRRVPGRAPLVVIARERDCTPDQHEPIRVLRDDCADVAFKVDELTKKVNRLLESGVVNAVTATVHIDTPPTEVKDAA